MEPMEQEQAYYETSGHVIAAGITLSLLAIATVVLRFVTRMSKNQGLKMDDWLILPATVFTVAIGASMIYGATQKALGYRTEVPPNFTGDPFEIVIPQLTVTSKIEFAFSVLLPLTLGFVKTSFLFLYMRIFSVDRRSWTHFMLVGLVVFIALWAVGFTLVTAFGCRLDFAAHWGSTHDLETKCVGSMQAVLALCVTDFVADLAIIGIPIPLVWRLNLSQRNKIAICGVFLLGAVTVAASLTRLIVEGRAVAIGFAPGSDSVLVITEYIYWGFVECTAAILAACLPTLNSVIGIDRIVEWPTRFRTLFSRSRSEEGTRSRDKDNKPPSDLEDGIHLGPIPRARLAGDISSVEDGDDIYIGPSAASRSVRSEAPLIKPDPMPAMEVRVVDKV